MKNRVLILFTAVVFPFVIYSQSISLEELPFSVKGGVIGGYILPLSKNLELTATGPVIGAELNLELTPQAKYDWESYWHYPRLGLGLTWFDLGNKKILGQAMGIYPYFLVPIVRTPRFEWHYKAGAGLSFFNKRWSTCDTLSGVNAATANSAIGSVVNVYLTTAMNFDFRLYQGITMFCDLGYTHMSNGSILQPNGGLNMLYGSVGVRYQPAYTGKRLPTMGHVYDLPYDFIVEVSGSGGMRELYYKDNTMYGVASLHAGASMRVTNCYAPGIGIDGFYDGVFVKQGTRGDQTFREHTLYERYFISNENFSNKLRVGFCITNDFTIGRFTAMLDWGFYLYDGIRNANPKPHPKYGYKRPMFYSYNIDQEDGWNYFRLGAKCRVWDNLYVQVSLKTHLQKAEMIDFGVGYSWQFSKKKSNDQLW